MTVVCYRPRPPIQDEKLNFVEAYFSEQLDPSMALWASTPGTTSPSRLIEILYISIFVLLVRLLAGVEAYPPGHPSLATPPLNLRPFPRWQCVIRGRTFELFRYGFIVM